VVEDTVTAKVAEGVSLLINPQLSANSMDIHSTPVLNKIPYVERLFKTTGTPQTNRFLLMVTPRIIIQEEEEELLAPPLTSLPVTPRIIIQEEEEELLLLPVTSQPKVLSAPDFSRLTPRGILQEIEEEPLLGVDFPQTNADSPKKQQEIIPVSGTRELPRALPEPELPTPEYLQDDVNYFPAGPEFKLSEQVKALEAYRRSQEPQQLPPVPKFILPLPTATPAPLPMPTNDVDYFLGRDRSEP